MSHSKTKPVKLPTESSFDDLSIQLEGFQETVLQNLVDLCDKALYTEGHILLNSV